MNRKPIALGALLVIMGAGAGYSLHAQTPTQFGAEPHPEIRKAMRALNNAQGFLQHADHDFKGHREKALDLTQQAIKECQAALAADK